MIPEPISVVLISSGQPSLNPRLVKEADALHAEGYDVTVLYQYWNRWGTENDIALLKGKPWKATRVGGKPGDITYFLTRLIFGVFRRMSAMIGFGGGLAELGIARGGWLLNYRAAQHPAALYTAHNIGALPAAVSAAKKNNVKCGFDAEDFHRNETSNDPAEFDVRIKTFIESKYIPRLDYLTTASPLISEAYAQLFPSQNPRTILNVFPRQQSLPINSDNKVLKLFWFSQTIGEDRGLEDVIKAMGEFQPNTLQLHLLGSYDERIKNKFSALALSAGVETNCIFYYDPIPSGQIISFASNFDIGLACELSVPQNRDICLTNKIFTYIQAGLAVLASDTKAQSDLLDRYPSIGLKFLNTDLTTLIHAIRFYSGNRDALSKTRTGNIALGQTTLNWENESLSFIKIVRSVVERN